FKHSTGFLNSGFTLIEMLFVVAIVGILSATVLSALGPARNKAKDARIISGINQVRALAEVIYDSGSQNPYSGIYSSFTTVATGEIYKVKLEIENQGGQLIIIPNFNPQTAYAAYSNLKSDPNKYYCTDSSGYTGTITLTPQINATKCQ
ncbi:MAG: type II secretion system protein, partial [Patescibacteria group bacterium]